MRLWLSFLVSGVLAALPLAAQHGGGGGLHSHFGGFGNPQPIPGSSLNGIAGFRPTITLNGLPLSSNRYPCPGCSAYRNRGFANGRYGYGYVGFIPLFDGYTFPSTYYGDDAGAPPPPPPVDPTAMAITDELGRLQSQVNQLQAEASGMPPAQAPAAAEENQPAEPPTVIVLRDGRRLETTNYAVMDSTLWNFSAHPVQKIPLSAVDISASEKANADRGVDFSVAVDSTK